MLELGDRVRVVSPQTTSKYFNRTGTVSDIKTATIIIESFPLIWVRLEDGMRYPFGEWELEKIGDSDGRG